MQTSAKLLLVDDDDDFLQLVAVENLAQLGYAVDTARDGKEAWEKIEGKPDGYDLVILDRNMPGMDGISLLKRIKADSRFAEAPVIMLTVANQPEDIVEGLAAGAYYYLSKSATQEALSHIINVALDESIKRHELLDLIGQQRNNLHLLQRTKFAFRTLNDAKELALFLADASMNPSRTITGYSELLVNAVEHGNLGITYAEKGMLLDNGLWAEEIERRLQSTPYADRMVEVVLEKKPDALVVTISDQGDGFDWTQYLEFDPKRAFDLNGRGIAMSKQVSFDSLEYLGNGNSVVATVRFQNQPGVNNAP